MVTEASQSDGDRSISGVDSEQNVQKESSEGDYEEIDILNTPFAMEYNMSYSMVTQTAM